MEDNEWLLNALTNLCDSYELELYSLEDIADNIMKLHHRVTGPSDDYICRHCSAILWQSNLDPAEYYVPYPCPTIEIIKTKTEWLSKEDV